MRVALLSAASVNGMITGGRGRQGHELESFLGTPREVMAHKAEIRRRHGASLVGTGTRAVAGRSAGGAARLRACGGGGAGLERFRGPAREVMARKAEIRRRHGAILVGTGTVLV